MVSNRNVKLHTASTRYISGSREALDEALDEAFYEALDEAFSTATSIY